MAKYTFFTVFFVFIFFPCFSGARTIDPHRMLRSYPVGGAVKVNPETSVGISYSAAIDTRSLSDYAISVIGSIHGRYSGSIELSDNKQTLIFTPSQHFALGESVTASIASLKFLN